MNRKTYSLLAAGALLFAGDLADAGAQSIVLDPNNPLANFERDGTQAAVPGTTALVLNDASGNDHIAFYSATSIAAPNQVVDVTATFRVISSDQPNGIETGMRLVITDGAVTSFIVGCVTLGGIPGVAIAIGQNFAGAESG